LLLKRYSRKDDPQMSQMTQIGKAILVMSRWFFSACVICVFVAAILLSGCASSQRLDSSTGGIELTLFVRDGGGSEEYYTVLRDGSLGFGGGMNARIAKVTWNDALTMEEIATLRDLIRDHDWCGRKWQSTREPESQAYRVSINSPECRRSFRLKGEHPDVQPVRELLRKASLRRLKSDLDRLPKPSAER
jgi:hypothetical protein